MSKVSPQRRLTHAIRGLFQFTSPVRKGSGRGVVLTAHRQLLITDMSGEHWPVVREVHGEEIAEWSLDLRSKTGRLHAALWIEARFHKLETLDIRDWSALGRVVDLHVGSDPILGRHYHAAVGAGQGDDLDAAEQRALAEVVLWVAERAP